MAQLLTPRGRHRVLLGVSSRSGVLLVAALQLIVGLTLLGIYEGFKASWLIAPPRLQLARSGLHVACRRSACRRRQLQGSGQQHTQAATQQAPVPSVMRRHTTSTAASRTMCPQRLPSSWRQVPSAAGCLACLIMATDGGCLPNLLSLGVDLHCAPANDSKPLFCPPPLLTTQSGFCFSAPHSTSCSGSARFPASERYLGWPASSQLSPR